MILKKYAEDIAKAFTRWGLWKGGGGSYTLPSATNETLGGVMVGSGLRANSNGRLSVNTSVGISIDDTGGLTVDRNIVQNIVDATLGGYDIAKAPKILWENQSIDDVTSSTTISWTHDVDIKSITMIFLNSTTGVTYDSIRVPYIAGSHFNISIISSSGGIGGFRWRRCSFNADNPSYMTFRNTFYAPLSTGNVETSGQNNYLIPIKIIGHYDY